MALIAPDGASVLLDDGRTFTVDGRIERFQCDSAGFTLTVRPRGREESAVMERHDLSTGGIKWWSYGPPHALVSEDRHSVLLPQGVRVPFPNVFVVQVVAFDGGFLVTTYDPKRKSLPQTDLSQRNVWYYGPKGELRWRIGEPKNMKRPAGYDGVNVHRDGSLWGLASEGMYMARLDPSSGDVLEIQPYK